MHNLSLLKTSKHLLQHGSPSAALIVWPPFFQTHPPQSASSWPVRTLRTGWLTAVGSRRGGKAPLRCVWGRHRRPKTLFKVRKPHSRAPSTQGFTHFARGVKTGNYRIKSLNPRGPDLQSIVCYCCIQIRDFKSRAWFPCGFIIIFSH